MGIAEVLALPWWERRLYVEGLLEEFSDPEDRDTMIDATPENLAGLGVTVGTV